MTKASDSKDWIIKYKRLVPGSFQIEEESIQATHVILGAGALGSTKLLFRSRERGLKISDQTGKRFSTNGDVLAFSYNGSERANSVGLETKHMTEDKTATPPGPCITSVADFRKRGENTLKHQFVIEDGTPPSAISGPYALGLMAAGNVAGLEKYKLDNATETAWRVNEY